MTMTHMEFAALESAMADETPRERAFSKWEREVLSQCYINDLDGDEAIDGFSYDGAWDAFERGDTPEEYVSTLPAGT